MLSNDSKTKNISDSDLQVFSINAEALHPSLDIEDILEGIWDLIMGTDADFNNVNIEEIG